MVPLRMCWGPLRKEALCHAADAFLQLYTEAGEGRPSAEGSSLTPVSCEKPLLVGHTRPFGNAVGLDLRDFPSPESVILPTVTLRCVPRSCPTPGSKGLLWGGGGALGD